MIHVLFFGLVGFETAVSHTQEFNDYAHCQQAASAYIAAIASIPARKQPFAYCMPKGETKKDKK